MKPARIQIASMALCAAAVAFDSASAHASEFRFVEVGSFPAGAKPAGMVIVDLNHDGRLDVLAANDEVSTVSVVLGQGILGYKPPLAYASAPTGRHFHHSHPLAIGDFNRDGHVDYAVTTQYGGPFYVSVSLGIGNGQFLAQVIYQVGTCPTSVSAVDTDGDGVLDLIVTNSEGHSISVLRGNANGTFQPRRDFVASNWPISTIAADFNGDGHADVAMVDWNAPTLTVLSGAGNGQFGTPVEFAVGDNPRSLVAGDFDRDGKLDVAVANGASGSISVLRGYGNGMFAAAVEYPVSNSGWVNSEPNSIVAADLDRDGNLDLAVADYGRDAIELFRGNRNGIFDAAQVITVQPSPSSIAAADFDGDGSVDLALLHYASGRLSVLLNDGIFDASFD